MHIICHVGELALKGKNRRNFERVLVLNMKERLLADFPDLSPKISNDWGRLSIELPESYVSRKDALGKSLSQVFGLSNFSFVQKTENNIDKIKQTCLSLIKEEQFDAFRISTRRAIKHFPLVSEEVNRQVGAYVVENTGKKVSLKEFDIEIVIEIAERGTYVYCEKIKGAGGMPVGTAGKGLCLLSGGIDSPVSAYMCLKRGMKVKFIHFHSVPYTSKESIIKVKHLAKILEKFGASAEIFMVPFADAQKQIMIGVPDKFRIIFYRRLMLKIAEFVAKKNKCKALITGDSLAQVASQTVENLQAVGSATDMLLLRPLISFDKEEIMEVARKIGTYDISIQPHDDCCTRLMPKKPETAAKMKEVLEAEKNLDIARLVDETMEKVEKVII